ncbi:MAG: hypothetical protein ACXABY_02600 [Candidatus Thorarchaeota archaeon]|jgi:hypothetical protein
MKWTNEWPTNPGWYWFYGNKYGEATAEIGIVRVIKVSNGVAHTLDGHFMFKADGHKGVFQSIPTPIISADIAAGRYE